MSDIDWLGKRPNPAWPKLTPMWFTTASMARHLPDGSTLHTLTEGQDQRAWTWGPVVVGAGVVVAFCTLAVALAMRMP